MLKDFPELWDLFVRDFADLYPNFLDYHVQAAEKKVLPTYYFRFEDLTTDPYPVLKEMFEFLFGVENIEGTYLDQRIKTAVGLGNAVSTLYQPRKAGIDRNRD